MRNQINIIYVSFCPFSVQFILLLFVLFSAVKVERRPQTSAVLCIFSLFALVAPSFGIAVSKKGKRKRKQGVKLQTEHQSEFFGISLFLSLCSKKRKRKKKKEFSLEGNRRGKSPINILICESQFFVLFSAGRKKDLWFA